MDMNKIATVKVIAVQCYGSSGSKFLQSLLDGHPDILSLPALYMREFFRFWEENAPFVTLDELANKFVMSPYHAYWFNADESRYRVLIDNGLTKLGANANEDVTIDRETYETELKRELKITNQISIKNLFVSVYVAYARMKNKAIKENMWLLFPIHANPKSYAEQLIAISDEIRFIYTLREPTACLYSLVNHLARLKNDGTNIFSAAIEQAVLDVSHQSQIRAYGFEPYVTDNQKVRSIAIRLEDLHLNSKVTLMSLCKWLSIPWNDCLLQSTFDGKLWNNGAGSIKQSGFNKSIIEQKYPQYSTSFDYYRMRILTAPLRQAFGYEEKQSRPISLKEKILSYLTPILLLMPFKADQIGTHKIKNFIETRRILYRAYFAKFNSLFNFIKILPMTTESNEGELK